jgi:hypothetical protein
VDVVDLKRAADALEEIEADMHLFVKDLLPSNNE